MSYLKEVNIDPHLQLHALKLVPPTNQLELSMSRINHLSKTRRFTQLQAQVAKVPSLSFPTLSKKLKLAAQKTQKQKLLLGEATLQEDMRDLQEKSKTDDGPEINERQLKAFKLAKIYYDEGQYQKSLDLLTHLERQDRSDLLWLQVTCARLYCQIVLQKEESKKTSEKIREKLSILEKEENKILQKKGGNHIKEIQRQFAQKQQFLNIICFAYFNNPTDDDLQKFMEICIQRNFFSTIQLLTPHIFRYVCAAMILNKAIQKSRQFDLFKLIQMINRQVVRYNDVLIQFLTAVYIEFDFQVGAQKLKQMKQDLIKDPFLKNLSQSIVENCQFLYYKVYCKVYQSIKLDQIASFVGKTKQNAQLWILKYIRSGDIQAKIDAQKQIVITNKNIQEQSQKYLQIIPKMYNFINNLHRTNANQEYV